MMRRALSAALLAVAMAASGPAAPHALVKHSVPADGAVLRLAPAEVAITFNEKIEKLFSSAELKDGQGKAVATGKAVVDAANPAVLRLPLPPLAAGSYQVRWAAVGNDGHRRSGEIRFSIK